MFSQQPFICSLQHVKNRVYNLLLAINDLFLFRIAGKLHLSINKLKHLFYCCHKEENKSLARILYLFLYGEVRGLSTWLHMVSR